MTTVPDEPEPTPPPGAVYDYTGTATSPLGAIQRWRRRLNSCRRGRPGGAAFASLDAPGEPLPPASPPMPDDEYDGDLVEYLALIYEDDRDDN